MTDTPAAFRARLEALSIPVPECGCWVWLGTANQKAGYEYGSIRFGRKMIKAHRASWIVYRGDIPAGLKVLHRCDVPSCINPDHLFLGTQLDNMKDMKHKGRSPNITGQRNPNSKLSDRDVIAIRQATGTLNEIAARFGIGKSMVSYIKRGENWKHI